MASYVLKRLLYLLPTLFGVTVVAFVITRILPGDPALMVAGQQVSQATLEKVRASMGLDKPLLTQYFFYLKALLRGDLGFAWHTGHPVLHDLLTYFPATAELTLTSLLIALVLGIPLGVASATKSGGLLDHLSRVIALVGVSMPIFWLGLVLISVFFVTLRWVPAPMGRLSFAVGPVPSYTGSVILDSLLSHNWAALRDGLMHLLLPSIALSTGTLAIVMRMTRASMLEELGKDYVRTARAKGQREALVLYKHTLKNALIPTVTVIGLQIGMLLGGAVITETIFAWPGMGRYVTESIMATDYAPVQGFALLSAFLYAIINLGVDILYAFLDPRIRYS